MLQHINIHHLIFIDIETVPGYASFDELSPAMKELWAVKHATLKAGDESYSEGYLNRAGIYSEFAKIICISVGFFNTDKATGKRVLRLKSISGDDEKKLLEDFMKMMEKSFNSPDVFCFCGHNIKEFDIPFICRRAIINGLNLPELFDHSGKKPWEVGHLDTMQLWKFGDYKSYTSLKLLAEVLGLPTPKNDIEGKDVCSVYWKEKNLPRIVEYCQKDVVTVARLLLRFKGEKQLGDEDVIIVN